MNDREIYLFGKIDIPQSAQMIRTLRRFDAEDTELPIKIFINSSGGSITDTFAIYDVMKSLKSEIHTICVGVAFSAAPLILTAGNKRFSYPNAQIMLHQPSAELESLNATNLTINTNYLNRIKGIMVDIFVKHTRKKKTIIEAKLETDSYFTAQEAKEFGLIDEVGYEL